MNEFFTELLGNLGYGAIVAVIGILFVFIGLILIIAAIYAISAMNSDDFKDVGAGRSYYRYNMADDEWIMLENSADIEQMKALADKWAQTYGAESNAVNERSNCHHVRAKIPFANAVRAVPIIPRAIPIAAKIPANLAISNGGVGVAAFAASPSAAGAGVAGRDVGIAFIFSVACDIILASFSAALLLIRFSIVVAILR